MIIYSLSYSGVTASLAIILGRGFNRFNAGVGTRSSVSSVSEGGAVEAFLASKRGRTRALASND
jgi:hypothetical protein